MHLFFLIATAALLVSLIAKLLADHFLTAHVSLVGTMIGLTPSLNPGIAFGVRLGGWESVVIPAALAVLLWVAWGSIRSRLSAVGFGLIVGGALGNIVDRMRDGLVTDFFQLGTFPIFNVADSCITVGVVVLLSEMLLASLSDRRKSQKPKRKFPENSQR